MNLLFFAQFLAHLSIPFMSIYGDTREFFISIFVYFLTGCIGVSMTFHRFIAHESWRCPRWLEILGTIFATLGLIGSSLSWVAIHRQHHSKVDTPLDPHSPLYKDFWKIQFLSMYFEADLRNVSKIIKDPFHQIMHRYYFLVNFIYVLLLLVIDPFALIYAYLFPAAILWNTASLVNTAGHLWGYRNFDTQDNSRNELLLSILTWGEGLHNNHHYNQKKYNFRVKWYEIDITGHLIGIFERFI